jgi:hypothetical protein
MQLKKKPTLVWLLCGPTSRECARHTAPKEQTRKAAVFYVDKYIRKFVGVLDVTQGSFDISTSHHHT